MDENIEKRIKWFESLLNVDGIKLAFGPDFSDDCSSYEYGIDQEYLSRKVLYFDKETNRLMTHAPGGSHWRRNSNILKISSNENFRWVLSAAIEGKMELLPKYRIVYVLVETNDWHVVLEKDINGEQVTDSICKLASVLA